MVAVEITLRYNCQADMYLVLNRLSYFTESIEFIGLELNTRNVNKLIIVNISFDERSNLMFKELRVGFKFLKQLYLFNINIRIRHDSERIRLRTNGYTIDYIEKVVCGYFNLPAELLNSNTRKREIVIARQVAMFFSKELTKESLAAIGERLGDKDHATVLYANKTVNNLIGSDKRFCRQIEEIRAHF